LENNGFSKLIMCTTDLEDPDSTVLPSDAFAAVSIILEMDQAKQIGLDPVCGPEDALRDLVQRVDRDNEGDADSIDVDTSA
jgi:hypothetical protein